MWVQTSDARNCFRLCALEQRMCNMHSMNSSYLWGAVQVNIEEFAGDLERLFVEIRSLDSEVDLTASPDMSTVSANVTVDNAQVNRLLLEIVRVGEVHGIRFPRYAHVHERPPWTCMQSDL